MMCGIRNAHLAQVHTTYRVIKCVISARMYIFLQFDFEYSACPQDLYFIILMYVLVIFHV